MSHEPKRLIRVLGAIAVTGGLGLGAAGTAAAVSSGAGSSPHPPQQTSAPQPSTSPTSGQGQGNSNVTPPGKKTETPDSGGTHKADTPDNKDGADKASETEPANDPEPNHQDPNGANVDHTPAGEQPEAGTLGNQQ